MAKRDVLSLASRKVLGIEFPRARDLGPIIIVWLVSLLVLMFERDLGSSLLFLNFRGAALYRHRAHLVGRHRLAALPWRRNSGLFTIWSRAGPSHRVA